MWVLLAACGEKDAQIVAADAPEAATDAAPGAPDAMPGAADAGVPDAVDPGGAGRIVGTVYAPNGDGFDVVAGARVRVAGGAAAVAAGSGAFTLDGVPAGTPLALVVEGPAASSDVYGTSELRVTVPRDATVAVAAHILYGCRAVIDGAAGGVSAVDRCAGAGGVSVTFPAQAFARPTGEAYTGAVVVEMAAVDPGTPGDFAALPADGMRADGPAVLGAAEVRLAAAETGEPLVLRAGSAATLRFEINEVPAELAGNPVNLESYDPATGRWVPEGAGAIVSDGGRRYFEAAVTHFTAYRGVACCIATPQTCILVIPRLCADAACASTSVCPPGECKVQITHPAYGRVLDEQPLEPNGLTGRACIRVPQNGVFDMIFKHPDATDVRRRVRSSTCLEVPGSACVPGGSQCTPATCTNIDNHMDRGGAGTVDLRPRVHGCVHGSFRTPDGVAVTGEVDVVVDGDVLATFTLPEAGACDTGAPVCTGDPMCESSVCAVVPTAFPVPGTQVELRDRLGNAAFFDPPPVPAPGTAPQCPGPRPDACGVDASPPCVDLGPLATVCTQAPELGCMNASFTARHVEDPVFCPGPESFRVTLDASASSGPISYFEWFIDGVLRRAIDRSQPVFELCLAPGTYRVRLETAAQPPVQPGVPMARLTRLRGRAEKDLTLLRAPCAARSETIQCTYSGDTRDCDTTLPGFPSTITTYAVDRPCGYPCFTGYGHQHPELLFEPVRRPITRVAAKGSAARVDYALDDLGNVSTATSYDANGNLAVQTVYSYDDPARPTRVSPTGSEMIWQGDRLYQYRTPGPLGIPLTFTYVHQGERLIRVETQRTNTGEALLPFVFEYGGSAVGVTGSFYGTGSRYSTLFQFDCSP
jgi:hypothetical protein